MNIISKSGAALLALLLILGVAGTAAPAYALTQAEVNVICTIVSCDSDTRAALQALVTATPGDNTPGVCPFTWSRNLTVGSTGADVLTLQRFLNASPDTRLAAAGAGSPGLETQYFGPITRSAVIKFQNKHAADVLLPLGLSTGTGFVGPSTRAKLNMLCVTAPTPTPTPDDDDDELQGGAGSIQDADYISTLSNEEVGEDEKDVEVAGLDIEADDGSDIMLTAVSLNFSQGSGAASDFEDYADEVSVWLDGELLARVDADRFDDDNNFDATISLESGGVIERGERGDLVVAVSGIGNLDSNDAGDSWTVEFESVRFRDAQGATVTDSSTGVINDGSGRTFSFELFATAANVELRLANDDEDVNEARAIEVDASQETDNVELLSFTMEAEGDSDLEIRDFGVEVVVTGATRVDDIIAGGSSPAIRLVIDGEEFGSAAYNDGAGDSTTEEIAFTDVDFTIDAGETVSVVVEADLLGTNDDLDAGDTVLVRVTESQTDDTTLVDVRDEANERLGDADITGSPTSGAHGLFEAGVNLTLVSTNATAAHNDTAADDDVGTFTIVFDATAFGGTVYVATSSVATTATTVGGGAETDGIIYRVYDSGTAVTDDLADLVTFTRPSGVSQTSPVGNIAIQEDRTTRITLTVTQTNDSAEDDGIYFMDLAGVGFSADDDTTYEFMYTFNLDEFETTTISLN